MYCDAEQQLGGSGIVGTRPPGFGSYFFTPNPAGMIFFGVWKKKCVKKFFFSLLVYIERSIQCREFVVGGGVSFSCKGKLCLSNMKADGNSNQKYFKRLCTFFLAAGKAWTLSNSGAPIEFFKLFCSKVLCYGTVGQRAGFCGNWLVPVKQRLPIDWAKWENEDLTAVEHF